MTLIACEDQPASSARFEVRDSLGVQIVESFGPQLGPGDVWEVSSEPILQIGTASGEDPYLFSSITSVLRLDDGRIVVCDGTSKTLRFFDPSGRFQTQVGGPGEGPGEFPALSGCERIDGGIAGFHLRSFVHLFDRDGALRQTVRFPVIGGHVPFSQGVFLDGSVLLVVTGFDFPFPLGLSSSVMDLFHVDLHGLVTDSLLGLARQRMIAGPDMVYSQAYGPRGNLLVAGNDFLYGWSAAYDIAVYDRNLNLRRRLRRDWSPETVTAEDREWWASTLINGPMPGGGDPTPGALRARRLIADIQVYPETHPAFDRLEVDRIGWLWVRRSHPRFEPSHFDPLQNTRIQRTWDVFDTQGRWVTTLPLPLGLEVHEIGRDYVIGVWRDEMDVEFVRTYRLDR